MCLVIHLIRMEMHTGPGVRVDGFHGCHGGGGLASRDL
jgi:hypothetical protein